MRHVITNCRIYDEAGSCADVSVIVEDDKILEILKAGTRLPSKIPQISLEGGFLLPGFIDIQVNGGGDVLFNDLPSVESLKIIAAAHRQYGTTGFLPTLISTDYETITKAIEAVAAAIAEGVPGILGIHLEGPFLSPEYAGIHEASNFATLDDESFSKVTALTNGVTMITLAPECVDTKLISKLVEAGVVVSGGHSAATFAEASAAIDAGLTGFTHLFNAMSPLTSREPGMVGTALADKNTWVGVIADGIHLHPGTLSVVVAAKAESNIILVTDAMNGVGGVKSEFWLAGERIKIVDNCCKNTEGTLAGSNLNMNDAMLNMMAYTDLSFSRVLDMVTINPAKAIGLEGSLGKLKPGYIASFVEVGDDFKVGRTWINGEVGD